MIKKLQNLSILLVFLIPIYAFSQVGIGTTSPDNSSILDLSSSNRGLLIPRLNLVATSNTAPVSSPAEGLLVYNLATVNDVTPGLYYWNGSLWISAKAGSGAGSASGWALNGNNLNGRANDGSTFLGTTSYHDLYLKLNNQQIGRLQPNGGVALGLGASSSANQAFAIGESASAGNTSNYAFGRGSNASGSNAYALGEGSVSSQNKSYALGQSSNASGTSAYAIGESSRAQGTNSYAIGASARSGATGSFAFGNGALSTSNNTLALGNESQATNNNSTALGYQAVSSHQNAVAIGPAQTAVDNTIILGNTTNTTADAYAATKVGIGTSSPTAKLQVDGTLRYVDGNQLNGRVLTTDADGNATWQNPLKGTFAYGEIYRTNSTVGLFAANPVSFNSAGQSLNINTNTTRVQTSLPGVYKITYTLNVDRNFGGNTEMEFFVTKGTGASNKIPGSSVFMNFHSNDNISSATKSFFVNVTATNQSFYVYPASTNPGLAILPGSSLMIELID
ncbi:MAG: hypothetical protein COA80_05635 [Leeuwenhoekiella sp.]|nr:MAG: hypothetical protein COA80_05635 [Leeuwenhoekiella sp.]